MGNVVVGVADCRCSNDPQSVLITYGLGSCIALALHDPERRIGGLLHFMLPESRIDVEKAKRRPYMFADTGVAQLLRQLRELGAAPQRLTVRAAGGAHVLESASKFDIGKRNYQALRKILWRAGLMLHAENVGGTISRTVSLNVATGQFWWRESNGRQGELALNGQSRAAQAATLSSPGRLQPGQGMRGR